ncbi:serine protease [Kitasatospora phosalacinea]|uniref:Serine protease n=1 Tax=Kitasatospora phosalacinea TaxID=2065 RepID=A0A9W6USY3_9ACTN|nr:serine protease [Kitasatospora phosalacinea]GLW58035.1 serine protease [Kitasatospora phosalacinea]
MHSACLTLTSALLLTFATAPGAHAIVGGKDASIRDFPFMLSLRLHNQYFCGATLIKPGWAVTAAHCVGDGLGGRGLSIYAGSSSTTHDGKSFSASKIVQAPAYNPGTMDSDIALIKLNGAVSGLRPADLPAAGATVPAGTVADIAGWGVLQEGGSAPARLQYAQVTVLDHSTCKKAYPGDITDQMLCAADPKGHMDACNGDSGGPLLQDNTLVGVISWGLGCASPGKPGVYTDVAKFRTWIDTTITATDTAPAQPGL